MNLSKHKKLVLAIASVLAFVIWLFPHWQVHVWRGGSHLWKDSGYSFLFLPPQKGTDTIRSIEGSSRFNITVDIDWRRQFYEWGTLAFLTGFALAGMAFWQDKPATRFGPRPPTLREPQPQNQSSQGEPQ
jgi:hypothetical protein